MGGKESRGEHRELASAQGQAGHCSLGDKELHYSSHILYTPIIITVIIINPIKLSLFSTHEFYLFPPILCPIPWQGREKSERMAVVLSCVPA